jgi:hypothetical protein
MPTRINGGRVTILDVTRTAVAIGKLSKQIPAEANARNNRRSVSSVVRAAVVAAQRCSAAVKQHETIEEAVFSVGGHPEAI